MPTRTAIPSTPRLDTGHFVGHGGDSPATHTWLSSRTSRHHSPSDRPRDKIRDVLSAALNFAVENGLLVRNPAEAVRVPPDRRSRRRQKPWVTPEQFAQLLGHVPEPYATMVYVAVFTGLRISELIGLRWNDVTFDPPQLTIDERYCRGDWDAPKSEASNATIPVNLAVIERIFQLKSLTVNVCGGGPGAKAVRRYRVVKEGRPR